MDFTLTDGQLLLRETVARYLTREYTPDHRRALTAGGPHFCDRQWRAFADKLGLQSIGFGESQGGGGGGAVENMIVMEEIGKALVLEPYLETVVLAGAMLKRTHSEVAGQLTRGIIAGDVRAAFAHAETRGRYNPLNGSVTARLEGSGYGITGHKIVVVGAPWATHYIVSARTGGVAGDGHGMTAFVVHPNSPGIAARCFRTIDGRWASDLSFQNVHVPAENVLGEVDHADELIAQAVDESIAAVCAEGVGCMRMLLGSTMDYVKQRRQFNAHLSEFQVVRHKIVDMFLSLELSVGLTHYAALSAASEPQERMRSASAAKAQVGRSARLIGQNAVQLHGAIGTTQELPLAGYFKRSTVIEYQFGATDYHIRRFSRLSNNLRRTGNSLSNRSFGP